MEGLIRLNSNEVIGERHFTHPRHTFYDRRILCYMLRRLGDVVASADELASNTLSLHLQQLEVDGRWHRIILNRPQDLQQAEELFVVGFLGQRRYDADSAEVDALDRTLLHELGEHPGLYSYSTMELTNGDSANCVTFRDETSKMHWSTSETHSQAAGKISPSYYYSIRLYNGHIAGGLPASDTLKLTCVKYYDFQQGTVWRAIRPFE